MSAGAGGGLPPRGVPAGCGAPAACAPAPRPRPPAGAGAGPSGTIRALVMVALSNLTLVRFSHGVAAAAAPRSTRAMLLIIGGPFGQTPSIHRLAAALATLSTGVTSFASIATSAATAALSLVPTK